MKRLDAHMEISIHHQGPTYRAKMAEIRELLAKWKQDYGIKVVWRETWKKWREAYRNIPSKTKGGTPADILPFNDGNPQKSWNICSARWCIQLHEGKLWKCCFMAYLPQVDRKYRLKNRKAWKPALEYRPLEHTCSDEALARFVVRQSEAICGLCPSKRIALDIKSPIRGVTEKALS